LPRRWTKFLKIGFLIKSLRVSLNIFVFPFVQVLELDGNVEKDNKKNMIIPRNILLAVRNDDSFVCYIFRGKTLDFVSLW
jgi:hypothetical protein